MKKITDYKIRIGDKLDYVEYESNERLPVVITDMIFDGFVFLIEFKHEKDRARGVTEYPDKLKQKMPIGKVKVIRRLFNGEEIEWTCFWDNGWWDANSGVRIPDVIKWFKN